MSGQRWRITDWSLAGWASYAWEIERARGGAPTNRRVDRHLGLFPFDRVRDELNRSALESVQRLIKQSSDARFGRPSRGWRAKHPTTPILIAVNNRLDQLDRLAARGLGHNDPGA